MQEKKVKAGIQRKKKTVFQISQKIQNLPFTVKNSFFTAALL